MPKGEEPAVGIEPTTARSQNGAKRPVSGLKRNGEDSNGSSGPAQAPKTAAERVTEPQRGHDREIVALIAALFLGLNIGDDVPDAVRRARRFLAAVDETPADTSR